jgi:hypothetical protein
MYMYSRIQVATIIVGFIGFILMLVIAKGMHEMEMGYMPYVAFLGAFICIGTAKGVLLDGTWVEDEEEEEA